MTVLCPGCRRQIRIPADKEGAPNLRARCAACGQVFAVATAERAVGSPAPAVKPPAPQPARPPQPSRPPQAPVAPVQPVQPAAPAEAPRPAPPAPAAVFKKARELALD